jgi:hypothetical protein
MPPRRWPSVLCALFASMSTPVWAGDQIVRGKEFAVTDSVPSDPARRKLDVAAREKPSAASVSGDPRMPPNSNGGVLHLVVAGATPSTQTFMLPAGTSLRGRPFWRSIPPGGFQYTDPDGEHGPVRKLRVLRSASGTFEISAKLRGNAGGLDIVPPNPGTEASLLLTLGSGDRYCVRFGSDAAVLQNDGRGFEVRRPPTSECPAVASGEFLALSYNVAGLPEGLSSSNPSVNTPLIAPLLNDYDLVLLQETWKTPDPNPLAPVRVYHEILEAGSTHPFKSLSAPLPLGNDPRRPGAQVSDGLNQFSRFPFGEITRVMWEGCDNSAADCLALKGFTMTRTTFAPGVTIDVYDLHGEAGGTPNDDVLRDAGITQLSTFIQTFSAGHPLIVGGDFNLHTDEEPDSTQFNRLLAETGLVDVCAALSCPQPGRIDKFLFRSSDALTITPLSWRFETDVFLRSDGEPLSDHDPLAVRFAWTLAAD